MKPNLNGSVTGMEEAKGDIPEKEASRRAGRDATYDNGRGTTETVGAIDNRSCNERQSLTPDENESGRPVTPSTNGADRDPGRLEIPDPFPPDIAGAVKIYLGLGFVPIPLNRFDEGTEQEKGKKPKLRGYRKATQETLTPELREKHWGNGNPANIGLVLQGDHVVVDLDSKEDEGRTAAQWLAERPELTGFPRERTPGGLHLHIRCPDLPKFTNKAGKPSGKALSAKICGKLTAELMFSGLPITVAPSRHKSGEYYRWEVTGKMPEVPWGDLCRWFGFDISKLNKKGKPSKEKPWWSKWKANLHTLNLIRVMRKLELLGECLDPDEAKWAVRCPWESEHSGDPVEKPGSATVVFNQPESVPGFDCKHAHCAERGVKELLDFIEKRSPGLVSENCSEDRVWTPQSKDPGRLPRIPLPGTGRSASKFATEVGKAIAPAFDLFRYAEEVMEVRTVEHATKSGAIPGNMLSPLKPAALVTSLERTVETGILEKDEADDLVFRPKSLTEQQARIVLASGQFRSQLPQISRLLDVPVPVLNDDGTLIYPSAGYDERFRTWLNPGAPKLRSMGLDEALELLLDELFTTPDQGGFWWRDEQARIHALARFITPFCRALMDWKCPPLWIFDGNREGCGKDTCADASHVLYVGRSVVGAPLSKDSDDELRKRITASLLAASRFFHLANMKGHIRYSSLEAATDNSGFWEDRILGGNEIVTLPNEMEFSFSANNATWEPDIERRCRRIRLQFVPDDVNGHVYRHTKLLEWIRERRGPLLSAVNALAVHWVREGCPAGPTPFTSFPEWGEVVGGILSTCGVGDPCLPHGDTYCSGDQDTRAMRDFFAVGHGNFGDEWVQKKELHQFVQESDSVRELFEWIDFGERRGPIIFGKLLAKFDGRELGGIFFQADRTSKNYCKYRFCRPDGGSIPTNPPHPNGSGGETIETSEACGKWEEEGCKPHATNEKEVKAPASATRSENVEGDYENAGDIPHPPTSHEGNYRAAGEEEVERTSAYRIVSTRQELDRVLVDFPAEDEPVALDIETFGPEKGDALNPWRGEIRLIQLQWVDHLAVVVDVPGVGDAVNDLLDRLSDHLLVGHNLAFDLAYLGKHFGFQAKAVFCTMTASKVLSAGDRTLRHNLKEVTARYLGVELEKGFGGSDWSGSLSDEQLKYATEDVAHLRRLREVLKERLEEAALTKTAQLEMKMVIVAVEMQVIGLRIDDKELKKIKAEAEANQKKQEEKIAVIADPELNPQSPPQLMEAFRNLGIDLPDTKEETLKECSHDLAGAVLKFRKAKAPITKAKELLRLMTDDGRVHPEFDPMAARTGRFSASKPNVQNLPRGIMRKVIVAGEGKKLIAADYSQIELRVAAVLADEEQMLAAYLEGEDLHAKTASLILGKPIEKVIEEERRLAKAVNFGLLFGQGAEGLVRYADSTYNVPLSLGDAERFRAAFFRAYPNLKRWHERMRNSANEGAEETRTRMGRRRIIEKNTSWWSRFSTLVNTPVQGTATDGMKLALYELHKQLPESAKLVSMIHDEVIVEVAESDAEEVLNLVKQLMIKAMSKLLPEIPIEVDTKLGQNWAGDET